MWQLFNIHNDYVKTIKDLEDEERSREGVVKELENFENEASKKKKEQAKYLKEITLREKRINEKNSRLDKSVSMFPTSGVCVLYFKVIVIIILSIPAIEIFTLVDSMLYSLNFVACDHMCSVENWVGYCNFKVWNVVLLIWD